MKHVKQSQPPGLYVLFFAEAWERFSYYGMRALLVLYMVGHLDFDKNQALSVYGTYTGLVYLTPVLGGYLADRFLGARKAILIGGIIMALGHLAMAFESMLYPALTLLIIGNGFFKPNISTIVGGLYEEKDARRDGGFAIFYMGINLGAFFSPLVCGSLGQQYYELTLFGAKMQIGGWHWGFGAAGIGMIIGLLVFLAGQRFLGTIGFPPHITNPTAETRLNAKDWRDIFLMVIAACLVTAAVMPLWEPTSWVVRLILGLVLISVFFFGWTDESGSQHHHHQAEQPTLTKEETDRIVYILMMCVPIIVFWLGFEQAGGTFNLFAQNNTALPRYEYCAAKESKKVKESNLFNLKLIGQTESFKRGEQKKSAKDPNQKPTEHYKPKIQCLPSAPPQAIAATAPKMTCPPHEVAKVWEMPASYFQSLNPMLIMLLAPLFSLMWLRMGNWKKPPSVTTKMSFGVLFLGIGFIIMFAGAAFTAHGRVNPMWLVGVYFFHTVGELCLSPVGLSMVTKVAPLRLVSLMMGVFFAATASANYLAGNLEQLLDKEMIAGPIDLISVKIVALLGISENALTCEMYGFMRISVFVTILSVVSFVFFLLTRKVVERLSHGRSA